MDTDVIRYSLFTWEEALHEFYLHLQATRTQKTQRYYEVQLGGLVRWATQENVPFSGFTMTPSAPKPSSTGARRTTSWSEAC